MAALRTWSVQSVRCVACGYCGIETVFDTNVGKTITINLPLLKTEHFESLVTFQSVHGPKRK